MKTLEELKSILSMHKKDFKKRYSVKQMGIFGSYVNGDANAHSDVDILVEFEKPIGLDFVLLADEIETLLGIRVDLVSLNGIKANKLPFVKEDLVYV